MDKKYIYIMYVTLLLFAVGGLCFKAGAYHAKAPKVYLKATSGTIVNVFSSLQNNGVSITEQQKWKIYDELKVKK